MHTGVSGEHFAVTPTPISELLDRCNIVLHVTCTHMLDSIKANPSFGRLSQKIGRFRRRAARHAVLLFTSPLVIMFFISARRMMSGMLASASIAFSQTMKSTNDVDKTREITFDDGVRGVIPCKPTRLKASTHR
jgi:hypothetical protein